MNLRIYGICEGGNWGEMGEEEDWRAFCHTNESSYFDKLSPAFSHLSIALRTNSVRTVLHGCSHTTAALISNSSALNLG